MNASSVNLLGTKTIIFVDEELDMLETEAKKVTRRCEITEPGCYYIEEANYGGEPCYYLSFMDLDGNKSNDNLFESIDQIMYFLEEQGFAVTE